MEDNNELIHVAMTIIMKAGNARSNANRALDLLAECDFLVARKELEQARINITEAHQAQTTIIQNEAAGARYKSCLLFTHAQDTLMTIMSEVNIAEKMVNIFEKLITNKSIG